MEPFVKNAADESQVKGADRKQKSERDRELNELRGILDTKQGRSYIWNLLGRCGVYRSSIDVSESRVYFNEGQRDIGLRIISDIIEAAPDAYMTMMKEAKEREANG